MGRNFVFSKRVLVPLLVSAGLICPTGAFAEVDSPSESTPPKAVFAPAQNDFGIGFYKNIAARSAKNNIIISPLSLHSCLRLALLGASGGTAQELYKILFLSEKNIEQANVEYGQLLDQLGSAKSKTDTGSGDATDKTATTGSDEKKSSDSKASESLKEKSDLVVGQQAPSESTSVSPNVLESAISVWADSKFHLSDDFKNSAMKLLRAEVRNVDFNDKATTGTINSWVSDKTKRKIPTIVNNTAGDKVLLLTAAYMKARWAKSFDKKDTQIRPFQSEQGIRNVHMMKLKGTFAYFADPLFEMAYLPYSGHQLGMVLVLPSKKSSLSKFTTSLSSQHFVQWMNSLDSRPGTVRLPRFTLDTELSDQCKSTLISMGMKSAFSDQADFRKMGSDVPPLSGLVHKGFIKVDEEGTEAAAATAGASRGLTLERPFEMILDRPFFYAIVHKSSGAILFLGQVTKPD